jgi:hypothetical protein
VGPLSSGGNLGDAAGYLFKGTMQIEDDSSRILLTQIIRRYMDVEAFFARARQDERLIVRLTPTKILKVR